MKLNIIIDSNFLLYKNVFILKNIRRLKQDLKDNLIGDLKKLIKLYPFDNIYLVSDSNQGNWRKREYQDYKGERKKDETIDWDFVYRTFEDFKSDLDKYKNIKYIEMDGLEGDDIIAHIVNITNQKNYSNLIIGSDKDLNQLLTYSQNKEYLNIQWNFKYSDERLYLPENYQLLLDKLSNTVNENLFELDNSSEFVDFVDNLSRKAKITTINKEESLFCKLVSGDKGDNIPTCVKVKQGIVTNEGRGIGKNGATTLYNLYKEIYPENIDFESDKFISNLADVIIYQKKIVDKSNKETIEKQLIFNRKMMMLNPTYIPTDIYERLKNLFDEIDNRIIEYEYVDLEKKMEEDDFFNEPELDIPEEFNFEDTGEKFDPDSFWDL